MARKRKWEEENSQRLIDRYSCNVDYTVVRSGNFDRYLAVSKRVSHVVMTLCNLKAGTKRTN